MLLCTFVLAAVGSETLEDDDVFNWDPRFELTLGPELKKLLSARGEDGVTSSELEDEDVLYEDGGEFRRQMYGGSTPAGCTNTYWPCSSDYGPVAPLTPAPCDAMTLKECEACLDKCTKANSECDNPELYGMPSIPVHSCLSELSTCNEKCHNGGPAVFPLPHSDYAEYPVPQGYGRPKVTDAEDLEMSGDDVTSLSEFPDYGIDYDHALDSDPDASDGGYDYLEPSTMEHGHPLTPAREACSNKCTKANSICDNTPHIPVHICLRNLSTCNEKCHNGGGKPHSEDAEDLEMPENLSEFDYGWGVYEGPSDSEDVADHDRPVLTDQKLKCLQHCGQECHGDQHCKRICNKICANGGGGGGVGALAEGYRGENGWDEMYGDGPDMPENGWDEMYGDGPDMADLTKPESLSEFDYGWGVYEGPSDSEDVEGPDMPKLTQPENVITAVMARLMPVA